MSELPVGTLTVLHTEIEGSTLLTVHLGDRYPEVLATHCALLWAACAAHEDHEVDTQGDSSFVVFPRATQAVAAAVARRVSQTTITGDEGRCATLRGNR
jgi:class 3 adenylate cyclase